MLTRLPLGGNDFFDQKYQTRLVSQINLLYLICTRNSDMPRVSGGIVAGGKGAQCFPRQKAKEACTDFARTVRQRVADYASERDDFALSILEDSLLRLESISVG